MTQLLLSDEEARIAGEARDAIYDLEAREHALDAAVRALRRKKLINDFLAISVAIGLLYLLYLIQRGGTRLLENPSEAEWYHEVAYLAGTGLSIGLVVRTIWGLMAKWDGQIEKKADLSRDARRLIGALKRQRDQRPLPIADIQTVLRGKEEFDAQTKHELATLPGWAMREGHQHVAMKYVDERLKCKMCGREWEPSFAQRRRWVRFVPFKGCQACGV
jgi:hypothetical protein